MGMGGGGVARDAIALGGINLTILGLNARMGGGEFLNQSPIGGLGIGEGIGLDR